MAITYNTATKNARMTALLNQIDADLTQAKLVIGTAAMADTLVTITLGKPSFSMSSGVLTLLGPKSGTASGSGTAAAAIIKDGADNTIVSGLTVGTSGTHIILDSTTITAADTVTVSTGTITHG